MGATEAKQTTSIVKLCGISELVHVSSDPTLHIVRQPPYTPRLLTILRNPSSSKLSLQVIASTVMAGAARFVSLIGPAL